MWAQLMVISLEAFNSRKTYEFQRPSSHVPVTELIRNAFDKLGIVDKFN